MVGLRESKGEEPIGKIVSMDTILESGEDRDLAREALRENPEYDVFFRSIPKSWEERSIAHVEKIIRGVADEVQRTYDTQVDPQYPTGMDRWRVASYLGTEKDRYWEAVEVILNQEVEEGSVTGHVASNVGRKVWDEIRKHIDGGDLERAYNFWDLFYCSAQEVFELKDEEKPFRDSRYTRPEMKPFILDDTLELHEDLLEARNTTILSRTFGIPVCYARKIGDVETEGHLPLQEQVIGDNPG